MSHQFFDYSTLIADRTDDFTGREWVFARINDWLASRDGPRVFLLTGAPGSGKSAISTRLVQFSEGAVLPPQGCAVLGRDYLSAFHFCSAREQNQYLPERFAESVALQLAARYPVYAQALAELRGDSQIQIQVEQQIDTVTSGRVTGVLIQHLHVSSATPEDAFARVVRQPLEALLRAKPDMQVVILVDALDEALIYSGKANIVTLLARTTSLPASVRFILTSRPDERIENTFLRAEGVFISGEALNDGNRYDIQAYVTHRFACDERLAVQIQTLTPTQRADLATAISEKAEGNFLYARLLLDAIASGRRSVKKLDGLPEGLEGLYYQSLDRVVRLGQGIWQSDYGPLLGVLSVAQSGLTLEQLGGFTGQSISTVWSHLGDLQQFVREDRTPSEEDQLSPARVYRLYHQSVVDFLRLGQLTVGDHEYRNGYYLPAEEWHSRIADYYWASCHVSWSTCDRYGLDNLALHLFHGGQTVRLMTLISKEWMQARYVGCHHTHEGFLRDLVMVWQAVNGSACSVTQLPNLIRLRAAQQLVQQEVSSYEDVDLETLVWLGREKEALEFARQREDPRGRLHALVVMHNALIAKGTARPALLDEAQKLKGRVTLLPPRLRAVCAVAVALTLANRTNEADAAFAEARIIEAQLEQKEGASSSWCVRTRGALAEALARAGRANEALELGMSLPSASGPRLQELEILGDLATTLQRVGSQATAQEVLGAMFSKPLGHKSGWVHGYELSVLAYVLADFDRAQEAKRILNKILRLANRPESSEDYRQRPKLLKRVASGFARTGQFSKAIDVAASIAETDEYADALREIAIALAHEERWEAAHEVIAEMPNNSIQASAKSSVASILARNGQHDSARQMLEGALALRLTVKRAQDRDSALRRIAVALAQVGRFEQARRISQYIRDEAWRDAAQSDLIPYLVQMQRFDDASEASSQLRNTDYQASALAITAAGLSAVGRTAEARAPLDRAVDMVETSDDEWGRSSTLRVAVFAMATEGNFDRAQEVAAKITVEWERAMALCGIAVQMVQHHRDEEDIHGMFVQTQ